MPQRRRIPVRLAALVALVGFGLLAVVCIQLYRASYNTLEYNCIVGNSSRPPSASVAENALISADWSVVPLGRACLWETKSGETVLQQPDWGLTALAGVGLGFVATAPLILLKKKKKNDQ